MCSDRSWPTWMSNHRYALHNFVPLILPVVAWPQIERVRECLGISWKLSMVRGEIVLLYSKSGKIVYF